MYGLDNLTDKISTASIQREYTPSPEERKRDEIRSAIWQFQETLRSSAALPGLVDSGILSADEGRRILDIDRFFKALDDISELSK